MSIISTTVGKNPLEEMDGVAIIFNKRIQSVILGCNFKNDRMISVGFQGKPFNITVIHVYAPTSNAEGAEVEWFYEDLQVSSSLKHLLSIECLYPLWIIFYFIDWNNVLRLGSLLLVLLVLWGKEF